MGQSAETRKREKGFRLRLPGQAAPATPNRSLRPIHLGRALLKHASHVPRVLTLPLRPAPLLARSLPAPRYSLIAQRRPLRRSP